MVEKRGTLAANFLKLPIMLQTFVCLTTYVQEKIFWT